MQDPFANEFCLADDLAKEQSLAAMAADASAGREWRIAAGVTINS